jgi:chromosome segregation ATPase
MTSTEILQEGAVFTVKNIGGIERTEVTLPPGVTVLWGKNATNRTSSPQAIMATLGSTQATLKGDADEGSVKLDLNRTTCERRLERLDDRIRFSGDPYLEDPEIADLFAFLLEANETRQAVAQGQDLRNLIMRPVDIDEIKSEIERLEEEKSDINNELATIESQKQEVPELEQKKNSIQDDIEKIGRNYPKKRRR